MLGIVAAGAVVTFALGGCVGAPPQVTVAEGTGLCAPSDGTETFGFGIPVVNDGSAAVRLTSADGSASNLDLEGPWVMPAPAGTGFFEAPVFSDTFPPTSEYAEWDQRSEVDGAELGAGETAYLFWGVTLRAGSQTGTLARIAVSYDDGWGEKHSGALGSWFGLAPAPDDPALGAHCDVPPEPGEG